MEITLKKGDITQLKVDAIVNAANTSLLGGGGVDGAIHQAAGPELLQECKTLNGCPTGMAKITKGYQLPASYVIHTVGPVWKGGNHKEAELLANAYAHSLKLAEKHQLKSVVFPNISTGVYAFPKEEAARIALQTVKAFANEQSSLEQVIFVCFDEENYKIYDQLIRELD
ncbi:O-acetyl-ADP-ribose deacetylase [Rapidithrix thailandica]|uniref:O-acetyl-ADP-ribose deacetylase n=1 Tax=Rapidithrix thailandica TaxID=413964 RepID=A0AAW9RZC0_9BACT